MNCTARCDYPYFFLSLAKPLNQVGWFTSDGAAVNHTTLRVLQSSLSMATGWSAGDHDML
jgi:hypothetical protein